jgi:undecaprenyl-diphosphatase
MRRVVSRSAVWATILCAGMFVALALGVEAGRLDSIDRAVHDRFVATPGSAVAAAGVVLAWAGSGAVTALTGIMFALVCGSSSRVRLATSWVLLLVTGSVVSWLVKLMVARRRPEGIVDDLAAAQFAGDLNAFPSGHAISSALLAVFVWRVCRNPAARVAVLVWAMLVSAARVALGVHWASDVAGGVVLAVALGLVWPLPPPSAVPSGKAPLRATGSE